VVTHCGRICLGKKKINFSTVFAGQAVGIKEVHDDIWLVSFMDYDLGYFDLETRVLEPLENPSGPIPRDVSHLHSLNLPSPIAKRTTEAVSNIRSTCVIPCRLSSITVIWRAVGDPQVGIC
jgi:hypothetical protein